jgi:hypothetical protein
LSLKRYCKDYSKELAKRSGLPEKNVRTLLVYVMGNMSKAMSYGCDLNIARFGRIYFDKKLHAKYIAAAREGIEKDRKEHEKQEKQ